MINSKKNSKSTRKVMKFMSKVVKKWELVHRKKQNSQDFMQASTKECYNSIISLTQNRQSLKTSNAFTLSMCYTQPIDARSDFTLRNSHLASSLIVQLKSFILNLSKIQRLQGYFNKRFQKFFQFITSQIRLGSVNGIKYSILIPFNAT